MRAIVKCIKTVSYVRKTACCAIFNGFKRFGKPPPVMQEATSRSSGSHLLQCKRSLPAMQKAIFCSVKCHKQHCEMA